jgi:hypothetical protein
MNASKKLSAEQAVLDALQRQTDATVAEVAAIAGVGRSTAGKVLAQLETSGRARRSAGGREGARRLPDRWSTTPESPKESDPAVPVETSAESERLRPGQLDGLVLGYLHQHAADGRVGPTAVARALGRSSGAVGNCLARLALAEPRAPRQAAAPVRPASP